ncbi:hypothetical protein AMECASPLE_008715 [Ameca splendens]|uniref:Uncharacterized protein n=1 Tax=Ameca splendens TaxID=208324 RepID=A0ABV1A6C1_9TELE
MEDEPYFTERRSESPVKPSSYIPAGSGVLFCADRKQISIFTASDTFTFQASIVHHGNRSAAESHTVFRLPRRTSSLLLSISIHGAALPHAAATRYRSHQGRDHPGCRN